MSLLIYITSFLTVVAVVSYALDVRYRKEQAKYFHKMANMIFDSIVERTASIQEREKRIEGWETTSPEAYDIYQRMLKRMREHNQDDHEHLKKLFDEWRDS